MEQDYIDKGEITQGKQLGKINLKQNYIDKGKITQDKLDNVIEIDRNKQVLFDYSAQMNTFEVLFDYSAQMNTLEIDTLLKKTSPLHSFFVRDYASRDQIYHFLHLTLRLFSRNTTVRYLEYYTTQSISEKHPKKWLCNY